MKKKINNPHGIKTPTNVDEFRENLRKYYLTIPYPKEYDSTKGRNDYPIEDYTLNVKEVNGIDLIKISDFSDIYQLSDTGFGSEIPSPSICPLVTCDKELIEFMEETNQMMSGYGYFLDESNYTIWEDVDEFLKQSEPKWITLDNQWFREYFILTLGKFSGYQFSENNKSEDK